MEWYNDKILKYLKEVMQPNESVYPEEAADYIDELISNSDKRVGSGYLGNSIYRGMQENGAEGIYAQLKKVYPILVRQSEVEGFDPPTDRELKLAAKYMSEHPDQYQLNWQWYKRLVWHCKNIADTDGDGTLIEIFLAWRKKYDILVPSLINNNKE